MNPNKKNQNSIEAKTQNQRNKNSDKLVKRSELASLVARLHKETQLRSVDQVMKSFQQKDQDYETVLSASKDIRTRKLNMDVLLGRKLIDQISEKIEAEEQRKITTSERRVLEMMLLADDFWDDAQGYLKNLQPALSKYVLPVVSALSPVAGKMFDALVVPNSNNMSETVTIKRRYQLTQLNLPVASSTTKISVNPGLRSFGQWLSQVAQAYQYYRINSLELEYIPYSSVTQTGQVYYYLELDPNASVCDSSLIPQQYRACSHAVYQGNKVTYSAEELNQTMRKLRVRNDTFQVSDQSEYDAGYLLFGSSVASVTLGNFYVTLDVAFSVPYFSQNQALPAQYSSYSAMGYSSIRPEFHQYFSDSGERRVSSSIGGIVNLPAYRAVATGTYRFVVFGSSTSAQNPHYPTIYKSTTLEGTVNSPTSVQMEMAGSTGDWVMYFVSTVTLLQGQYVFLAPSAGDSYTLNTGVHLFLTSDMSEFVPPVTNATLEQRLKSLELRKHQRAP